MTDPAPTGSGGRPTRRVLEAAIALIGLVTAAVVGYTVAGPGGGDGEEVRTQREDARPAASPTGTLADASGTSPVGTTPSGTTPAGGLGDVNDTVTASDPAVLARAISGTWQGRYRCSQGLTALTLVLFVEAEGRLLATFEFGPIERDDDIPRGSFAMTGTYSASELRLEPDYWIQEPAGYTMIGMSAPITDVGSGTLAGEVGTDADTCHGWSVRKTSSRTQKPPV